MPSGVYERKKITLRQIILTENFALIQLNNGEFSIIDIEDVELVGRYNWSKDSAGYAQARVNGKTIRMHRIIRSDIKQLDHKNRNKLDNRKDNLRPSSPHQNNLNKPQIRGSSRFQGVTWDRQRNKWIAWGYSNGKSLYLGGFEKEEDAAKARDLFVYDLDPEFAVLNFPRDVNYAK